MSTFYALYENCLKYAKRIIPTIPCCVFAMLGIITSPLREMQFEEMHTANAKNHSKDWYGLVIPKGNTELHGPLKWIRWAL